MLEGAFVDSLSNRKQPVPPYQRQHLRDELAKEIFALRKEMGFTTISVLARTAKISIAIIGALEEGQCTKEDVTILALHKIAMALDRALVIKINSEEQYFSITASVEKLHQAGAKIIFSREG